MNYKNFLFILILITAVIGVFYFLIKDNKKIEGQLPPLFVEKNTMFAILKTNFGDIKLEFFSDDAPNTVENFVTLAESGFYDGVRFHRVIKDFMIQGGDPLSKEESMRDRWGVGGPGYTFADEIHKNNQNNIGTISMANAGPNTNGSQFFINTTNNSHLDTMHTVFGKVVEGIEVVMEIEKVETTSQLEGNRPLEDVIINNVEIIK